MIERTGGGTDDIDHRARIGAEKCAACDLQSAERISRRKFALRFQIGVECSASSQDALVHEPNIAPIHSQYAAVSQVCRAAHLCPELIHRDRVTADIQLANGDFKD